MEERRDAIVELVNRRGSVTFAQLKAAFPNVSDMTLRTDLKALDQSRRIVRVHGGARSVELVVGTDDLLGRRLVRNPAAKELIARKAVGLLRPDSAFFLDSGSTATALARLVPDERYLIFTNSLSCATELARLERAQVSLPGGVLNRYSLSLCGSRSIEVLGELSFDLCFLGVTSYHPDAGFSCGMEEEARLKRAAMARAERVVVLMDSGKVGFRRTFSICGLDEVDILISDGGLPPDFLDACHENGVEVL